VLASVERDVLDMPPLGEADVPPQNSYVYGADGNELAELNFEENRVPVTLGQIPPDAINAVLATEDAEFYNHRGVNHAAIVRAAMTNFRSGEIESGASTITQQYVKLAFLSPEQTVTRKIQEAIYAIEIEERYSKEEILERYLNRSYFGAGVYGIGTAADRYFSKPVEELTLGESAMLAGLLRSPERNNPIANPDNARARRDIVLNQMAYHGFVTRAQADAAIAEELTTAISEPPAPENPFWVEWVSRLLTNDDVAQALGSQTDALDAMGASFEERRRTVFQSGLRIHTTLDPSCRPPPRPPSATTSATRTSRPRTSRASPPARSSRSSPRPAPSSPWRSGPAPTAPAARTTAGSAPAPAASSCATAPRSTRRSRPTPAPPNARPRADSPARR
jgi:penicillin-binding protein 1A